MAYSVDFRKCVLENLESGNKWDEVISIFSISRDTLSRWVNLSKKKGSLEDNPREPYKVRKIDSQALICALERTPDATLKELAEEFNCWPHAIHRRLKKLGITRKKTTLYAERDEKKRQEFLTKLKELDSEKIVYIDESGIDPSLYREYARSKRGKRVKTDIFGKKSERTSLISGWIHQAKEFIAPYAFNGYTDSTSFNQWLEECLLPVLGPSWTIILDNASFHKGVKTKELVEKAGCRLLYLPPYSPDFNPIENQWATLKNRYKAFK